MSKFIKSIIILLSLYLGHSFYNYHSSHLEPVTLCLEWFVNPHHAPIIVGIEKGFFKEVGIDLKIIPAGSSSEGSKQVAVGKADLAISSQPQMMIKIGKGLPLIRIATLIPTPLEVFITKIPLENLKGKRIGHCSSLGFSGVVLQKILEQENLSIQDVTETLACNGLALSLLSGKVDAVMNMYRTYAIDDIKQFDSHIISYNIEDFGVPAYEESVIVANTHSLGSIKIINFIKALEKSLQYLQANPKESWKVFIHRYPELNTNINRQIWDKIIQLFTLTPAEFNQEAYQKMEDFLQSHSLIPNDFTHAHATNLLLVHPVKNP
jgi:putative hydroxymethylpyrimidine transport system substrate-binding protein